ncbi:DUF3299 domain-containing protein [Roseibium sp.]|uniref:DUF3299 domain-containing protein n=1 Tax=Roseibium sp. TaxID=1936156 RepID=UPI003A96F4CC
MTATRYWIALAAVMALLFALPGYASPLSWNDLPDPDAQNFEDPYSSLGYEELTSLQTIDRLRSRLKDTDGADEARPRLEARLKNELARLKASDIDPDWLISQRWVVAERRARAATAGNADLDGKAGTLMGFVIPAPLDDEGRTTAYLVPERGMCSHTPPPPPNQLIRLVISDGWYPEFLYEPIEVSGVLAIDPSDRRIRVVDGLVQMASTFTLTVERITALVPNKEGDDAPKKPWPIKPRSIAPKAEGK